MLAFAEGAVKVLAFAEGIVKVLAFAEGAIKKVLARLEMCWHWLSLFHSISSNGKKTHFQKPHAWVHTLSSPVLAYVLPIFIMNSNKTKMSTYRNLFCM